MTPEAQSAYSQLFSVGLLWITLHCAGMCGPLLVGLDVAGVQRRHSASMGAGRILTYQAGRAVTYAWLGALFGLFGNLFQRAFELGGAVVAVGMGAVILVTVVRELLPKKASDPDLIQIGGQPGVVARVLRAAQSRLLPLAGGVSGPRTFLLGALLGFMPCMITIWVLGLAAVSGSPLHGAALMVLLVAMTTPMLLGVTLLPRALGGEGFFARRLGAFAQHLPRALFALSGLWLVLLGLAGAGVIDHAHLSFFIDERHYMIMFW